jgi:hypothetical protein
MEKSAWRIQRCAVSKDMLSRTTMVKEIVKVADSNRLTLSSGR